jgi:hypothetical protein
MWAVRLAMQGMLGVGLRLWAKWLMWEAGRGDQVWEQQLIAAGNNNNSSSSREIASKRVQGTLGHIQ